jgi:hypothetical protein
MQEAQLDLELEQDIGESGKMLVMYTLQALHKELLAKHRELEHSPDLRFLFTVPAGGVAAIQPCRRSAAGISLSLSDRSAETGTGVVL